MAQKHLFGKTLSFIFRPAADDEDVSAYSLSAARIYSDYPTEAQVEDSAAGHIQEVTTWTPTGIGEYTIDFAALTDDDPHSSADSEKYYVAVNYKLESGGADIFDVETIFVYRPDSATSKISTSYEDVIKLESRVEDVAPSTQWVEDKVSLAVEEIIARLEARGYKKRRIFNWQKLDAATARLACSLACDDLAAEGSQFWAAKADKWMKSFERMFDSALVGYDIDGDDNPEAEETVSSGAVFLIR